MDKEKLESLVLGSGKSPHRIAMESGISVSTIYRWLHGTNRMGHANSVVMERYFKSKK